MADDTDQPHEDETRRPHASVLGSVLKTQDPGSWATSRPKTLGRGRPQDPGRHLFCLTSVVASFRGY
eukprot:2248615-Prymnesium_polylepis.1